MSSARELSASTPWAREKGKVGATSIWPDWSCIRRVLSSATRTYLISWVLGMPSWR